ncbi:MAG: hypothetical protein A2Y62_20360 [Candidatus Fischerbacteria bacterium RBG_13_37_8]|uniref:Nucleotidyltransferase n=1 Tax=Candidatus Fischerbacteria bacterium RBG_13_37_8 TaxID=1817863 RepID=A0A1F5VVN0_9BACT|nr:MAG: hypothetical protein A2Y62_20360 [Candidatus Fischerbacteria bacterium RBG_13_37_8]
MSEKREIDKIISGFNKKKIDYVLIGRQAVMLYGAPLFSYDYDFWIHPGERIAIYEFLEDDLECESSKPREMDEPLVIFTTPGGEKIDIFFSKRIVNLESEIICIEKVLSRAKRINEPGSRFYIMVPAIDDLIKLKKVSRRPKDLEDITYLEEIKKHLKF